MTTLSTALPAAPPTVTLVGAGPGAPDLLTVRAVRALRRATVVLVDDLVDPAVLRWLRPGARVVPVGKRGGCASTSQAFIHRLMVAEARRGERVVRLKGGDPFVFGRGGEECDALRAAGIAVEVVSGLTAGIAAPAAAGIPVTDRRCAPGVAFVTGHVREGGAEPDWAALARSGLTLVIYMGVARCDEITAALRAGGLPAHTPAAVVQHGCSAQQRQHVTVLGDLSQALRREGFGSPAILVVGDVAEMALAVPATEAAAGDAMHAGEGGGTVRAAEGGRRAAAAPLPLRSAAPAVLSRTAR